jgi:hypothetical protein
MATTKVIGTPNAISSGTSLDNGLAYNDGLVQVLRGSSTTKIVLAPAHTLVERVRAPDSGATLARVAVKSISATPATAGTYTLDLYRESDTGTTAAITSSSFDLTTTSYQFDVDVTLASNTTFTNTQYLKMVITSNNSDLSGGEGLLITPLWSVEEYVQPIYSPSEADWIVLTSSQLTKIQDGEPMETASPTMSGDYLQIGVGSSLNRNVLSSSLLYSIEPPTTNLTDSANGYPLGRLFYEITLGTEFTGYWGVALGLGSLTDSAGAVGGVNREDTNDRYALRNRCWGSTTNNINVYISPRGNQGSIYGSTESWGGGGGAEEMVFISNILDLKSGACEFRSFDRDSDGIVAASNVKILLAIFHHSSTPHAETLDFRIRYAWAPVGFLGS